MASRPTLSRFENVVSRTDLFRLALAITGTVIEWKRRKRKPSKVRRILIDMDPTDDPTYGDQQRTFFNAYYDRLVPRLREAFPNAQIYARMDGAFATPEVLSWLEAHDLRYLVHMPKNSVLEGLAEPLLKKARALAQQTHQTATLYGEVPYQAGRWKEARRAVLKAEVVALEEKELRDNPRFVLTNLSRTPQGVCRLYRERGDMENRIKELQDDLRFDLTSCASFKANQLRNLMTAAACILYQQLRHEGPRTELARAQVGTLRDRLIKIGTTIRESVRRIVLEIPEAFGGYDPWRRLAHHLGAVT